MKNEIVFSLKPRIGMAKPCHRTAKSNPSPSPTKSDLAAKRFSRNQTEMRPVGRFSYRSGSIL